MTRRRVMGVGLVVLAVQSCTPQPAPGLYDVTLSASGELALVRATTPTPTIAGIEGAALIAATGRRCRATAAPVIYKSVQDARDAVLPPSAASRFAGRYPVTLDC